MKNNQTTSIKSRAYNQIQRLFHPKDEYSVLSTEAKLTMIGEIIDFQRELLWKYKKNRKVKREVERLRKERGYVPKKKTTFAEWVKMCEAKAQHMVEAETNHLVEQ
jgi:hypothetical protein